jgi:hypothetical protein
MDKSPRHEEEEDFKPMNLAMFFSMTDFEQTK